MTDQDLELAIDMLKAFYAKAQRDDTISAPIAWALYKTWRYFVNGRKDEDNACDRF